MIIIQTPMQDGAFMEHAEVHGNFYGTTFNAVDLS